MTKRNPQNICAITWSTPDGRFGMTDIHDCASIEEGAEYFFSSMRGKHDLEIPVDADIDTIRLTDRSILSQRQ